MVLSLCVLLLPTVVEARANVDWAAPAQCPSAAEARAEIAQLLQRDLNGVGDELTATVEITQLADASFQARVAVHAGGQRREHVMRDASCVALTRAAALVIALAIAPASQAGSRRRAGATRAGRSAATRADGNESSSQPARASSSATPSAESSVPPVRVATPNADATTTAPASQQPSNDAAAGPVAPADEPAARAPVAATARPAAAPAAETTTELPESSDMLPATTSRNPNLPEAPTELHLLLGAAGSGTAGILPKLAPEAAIWFGLLIGNLRTSIRLEYAPPQTAWLPEHTMVGGSVALAAAALELGVSQRLGRFEIPVLGGVATGMFVSRGVGVTERRTRVTDWLGLSVRTGLGFTWDELWFVALHVEGVLALRRPSFALDGGDTSGPLVFHRVGAFGARLWLALELHL